MPIVLAAIGFSRSAQTPRGSVSICWTISHSISARTLFLRSGLNRRGDGYHSDLLPVRIGSWRQRHLLSPFASDLLWIQDDAEAATVVCNENHGESRTLLSCDLSVNHVVD